MVRGTDFSCQLRWSVSVSINSLALLKAALARQAIETTSGSGVASLCVHEIDDVPDKGLKIAQFRADAIIDHFVIHIPVEVAEQVAHRYS
jgi:hypothetical protein